MTLTACQKDEVSPSAGATSQTITVSIPQGVQTRAAAADFGDGSQIDRCLLQIYRNGQPYGEQQTATVTGNTATFNLRLVAQQKYDFVFWADCSEAGYETDDLSAQSRWDRMQTTPATTTSSTPSSSARKTTRLPSPSRRRSRSAVPSAS